MSVWKRNAVVVAIVLFVGAAVYLNWSYNSQTGEGGESTDQPGKVLGQSELVNGEEDGEGDAVLTGGNTASPQPSQGQEGQESQTGYFSSARLNRQRARDNALALLQEAQGAAQALLAEDPDLSRPEDRPVLDQVRRMFSDTPDIFN